MAHLPRRVLGFEKISITRKFESHKCFSNHSVVTSGGVETFSGKDIANNILAVVG
jgi:hypothetical protein